jgi:hypothetical protein
MSILYHIQTDKFTNRIYDKIREGPSEAALDKLLKDERDLVFSNKNLEVHNDCRNHLTEMTGDK